MAFSAQTPRQQPPATMADFLVIPADDRWHEFVDGKITVQPDDRCVGECAR